MQKNEFSKQPEFVWLKSVKVADNLLQIQRGLAQSNIILNGCDSVFHRLDCFRQRYERSLHKIRSLVVRYKYRKVKRQRYFVKKAPVIKQQL
jgi:hypothetical protein